MKTPEDVLMQEIRVLTKNILNLSYVEFEIKKIVLEEDVSKNKSTVSCDLHLSNGVNETIQVRATGSGLVDALFHGMLGELSTRYCSLDQISFEDFAVSMTYNSRLNKTGSDSKVHVVLAVSNSNNSVAHFSHESRSMNSAAINVIMDVMEYYVNCELAVLNLNDYIEDAKKRNRVDLLEIYMSQLAELVRSTSYAEVLKKHRQKN